MPEAERFPFTGIGNVISEAALMPYLPIVLSLNNRSAAESGLLDTGATVNVMPYHVGVGLGAIWEEHDAAIVKGCLPAGARFVSSARGGGFRASAGCR